jgi:putative PEP-CTERM system TPR-repeat lipoprotein
MSQRSVGVRLARTVGAGLLIVLGPFVLGLWGCGDSTTSEEYLSRAEDYLAEGDFSAAVIELRNSIREDPTNAEARLRLGELHLRYARFAAAEKELTRARDLGIEEAKLIAPLSRAWNAQGGAEKTLAEFRLDNSTPPEDVTSIAIARGWAYASLGKTDDAARSFEAALVQDKENPEALVGLGRLALADGDPERAQEYLERAIAAAPNQSDALEFRGELAMANNKPEEAVAAYQVLFDKVPQNPFYELELARAQVAADMNDEAIVHLESLLKRAPQQPDINYLRALAAYREKDFETAKAASDRALAVASRHLPSMLISGASAFALEQYELAANRLKVYVAQVPADDRARRLYGATLMRMGANQEAREVLEPLAEKTTDDAELLAAVATAAVLSGDLRAGAKYFEQVAALQPDNAGVRAQIGVIKVSLGEEEQGLEDLERAIKADPALDRAQVQLILTYLKQREFDEAIAAAERLQEASPDNPTGPTLVGIAQAGKGDIKAAKAAFRRALEIKPGAPDASGNLAGLELREGNTEEALAILHEALEKNPGHLRTLLRVAQLEHQTGEAAKAEERLEVYIKDHPDALLPRLALARFLLGDGEPQHALDLVEGKLARNPDNAALLAIVGQGRLAVGRPADAANVLRRLVEKQPQSADAHFLLAQAYQAVGDQGGYRVELEKTLELAPDRLPAKFQLASLAAQQGDMTTAKTLVGELTAAAPEDPNVIELEGGIAIRENRPADAVEYYKKAATLRPHDNVILKLAEAQRRAGDPEGGRETLRSWVEEHPDDVRVRSTLGTMELTDKHYEAAKEQFAAIVEAESDNAVALNNLAWLLWNEDDAESALPHAERAVELAPDSPAVADTAGIVHLKLGNIGRAVTLLRKAAARLPDNAEVQYHYAQALAAQGSSEEARDVLRSALSKGGAFSERADAEALLKKLGG